MLVEHAAVAPLDQLMTKHLAYVLEPIAVSHQQMEPVCAKADLYLWTPSAESRLTVMELRTARFGYTYFTIIQCMR